MPAHQTTGYHAAEEKRIFTGFLLFLGLITILFGAALFLNWKNPELHPALLTATGLIAGMDLLIPVWYYVYRQDLAKAKTKDQQELAQGPAQATSAEDPSPSGISQYLR